MSIDVEARLAPLCREDDTLLGYAVTGSSEDGLYVLVCRSWPHRDVDGAHIVSLRYAWLTETRDADDGWLENGVEMRVPEGIDPADWLGALAQWTAKLAAVARNGETNPHGTTFDP